MDIGRSGIYELSGAAVLNVPVKIFFIRNLRENGASLDTTIQKGALNRLLVLLSSTPYHFRNYRNEA